MTARPSPLTEPAVELTRLTREHPQVRMGASVRGAIDLVRLGRELSALRGEAEPAPGDATFADAAIAALSGRLRLDESSERTPEEIMLELIERLKPKPEREEPPKGKAAGPPPGGGARPVAERRRGARRRQRARPPDAAPRPARAAHAQLEQVSPAVGAARRGRVPRPPAHGCRRRRRAARRPRRRHRPAAARPGAAARVAAVRAHRAARPEHPPRLPPAEPGQGRGRGRPRPRPDARGRRRAARSTPTS